MKNIPKGYMLVPVEPTKEMLDAAYSTPLPLLPLLYLDSLRAHYNLKNKTSYKAMVAAAPAPPQPIFDEAKQKELFESWYGELPTTKFKETMWMAWEACAQSRAKAVEVDHE